jgi:hypothetical protein
MRPSREELETSNVRGSHHTEMPAIQCRDLRCGQPLGDGDHGGVHCPKSEVRVSLNELGCTQQVTIVYVLDDKMTGDETAEKVGFHTCASACRQ